MDKSSQTLRIPHLGKRTSTVEQATITTSSNKQGMSAGAVGATHMATNCSKSYTSEELFGAQRELTIMHRGECYSLRVTSLGRLILTK